MNKRTSIIVTSGLIGIILILLVVLIFNLNKKTAIGSANNEILNVAQNPMNYVFEEVISTNSDEIKISPNASITFFKCYQTCGHTVKSREIVTNNMVNLTKEELYNLYRDWQINKFTSNEIELYKEFDGSCGEHYLVKSVDGYINIYNLKEDGSATLEETTDIAVKYLAVEDINELENGIILYGRENLNAYIENFE